jgi:aryl-alcohol dehydrogenase-like predicted oxidoreductase
VDERSAADIINRFIDLGGNFIDATGSHPDARSEVIVGQWMRNRRRQPAVLVGTTVRDHHDPSEDRTRAIIRAVDGALERLRRDHLDVLSVRLDGRPQAHEMLVAAHDLVRSGKVRFVAANAPTADQFIEACRVAGQLGVAPLVAVQADYNLVHRTGYEPELSRVVTLQGCGFMPRQPLAGGLLAGRHYARHDVANLRRGIAVTLPSKRCSQLTSALEAMGADLGVTAPAVALAWLLARPSVTAPIVGVSSPSQLDDAMVAVRIQLTRQQAGELDQLSR